jgi:hypothetical protein
MASHFPFPEMTLTQIVEGLHSYNITPNTNFRVANLQSELLPYPRCIINILGPGPWFLPTEHKRWSPTAARRAS